MENILLFGESGMGKTTLINDFKEKCSPISSDTTASVREHPIIIVLMPPEPNHEDIYKGVLKAVNIPYAKLNHLNVTNTQDLVRGFLEKSRTRTLIIDEINSLLVGSPREQRVFLQHLRYISNDCGISLVCVGTPDARNALYSDPQLRRRFLPIELPLWEDGIDLQDFVNHSVQALPLRQPSPVESQILRQLLVSRSEGITHYICKAIDRAAIMAIRSGREMIDLDSFQDNDVWGTPGIASGPLYKKSSRPPRSK
jgi:hypothetical protein